MRRKTIGVAASVTLAVTATSALWAGNASASDPSTSAVYDVNTTTWSIGGTSSALLSVKSVQCDSNSATVIGGGVIDNDATTGGSPPNGDYFSVVSSVPQYGGTSAKDTWTVIVRVDGGTSGRTFSATAYAVCAK